MQLWHGGCLPAFPEQEIAPPINGRYEFGPGLYLTTNYGTALKYGKGRRKVYKVTLPENLVDLEEKTAQVEILLTWLSQQTGMRNKNRVIADIQHHLCERQSYQTEYPLIYFLNSLVNHACLAGKFGQNFATFMVSLKIDCILEQKADEDWLIIFNPSICRTVASVPLSKVDMAEYHLPRLNRTQVAITQRKGV